MNAPAVDQGQSLLWRILTKRIGPDILPHQWWKRRPGPEEVIRLAGLPPEAREVVSDTVRRTPLWRSERAEVAAELCAHFLDGLASGRTAQELVDGFGDARTAAELIRRAKVRGRPLPWRILRRSCQFAAAAAVLLVLLIVGQVLRFMTATPSVSHNYLPDLNASAMATPEPERAWTVYRSAVLARTKTPPELHSAWGPVTPADTRWGAVIGQVRANRQAISLIREAARLPRFGYVLTDKRDAEVWARYGAVAPPGSGLSSHSLLEIDQTFLTLMQGLGSLLVHDGCVAADNGDGATVVRDISDLVAMAGHLRQLPILPAQLHSLAMFGQALDLAAVVLHEWPETLREEECAAIAHSLANFAGGGAIRVRFDGERAYFMDLAQRLYTESGMLTPAGLSFMRRWAAPHVPELTTMQTAAAAIDAALVVPSRDQFVAAYERALASAESEAAMPLHARPGREPREAAFQSPRPYMPVAPSTMFPQEFFLPALRAASLAADQAAQLRDAIQTRLALEIYRRRHGAYPGSLSELVPALLPAVPMDRYDGTEMKYLLRDGRPVLYVAGADRDDDGGRAPDGETGNRLVRSWLSSEAIKALLANPTLAGWYDGDWILWPPTFEKPYTPAEEPETETKPAGEADDPA